MTIIVVDSHVATYWHLIWESRFRDDFEKCKLSCYFWKNVWSINLINEKKNISEALNGCITKCVFFFSTGYITRWYCTMIEFCRAQKRSSVTCRKRFLKLYSIPWTNFLVQLNMVKYMEKLQWCTLSVAHLQSDHFS